jgi:hypothetical protein
MELMTFFRNAVRRAAVPASLGATLLLGGCSETPQEQLMSGNVQGRMLHTPETFGGTSTGGFDGNGTLKLLSSNGVACSGPYQKVVQQEEAAQAADPSQSGRATVACTDGRKGTIMFLIGQDEAVGSGMLGRDIVTITIVE